MTNYPPIGPRLRAIQVSRHHRFRKGLIFSG